MTNHSSGITTAEHRIATPLGDLFAMSWTPPAVSAPPILLFHDSLGCIELWRDFPAQLAAATHRRVIAYDRLGYGRSAAHPGPQPHTFIEDEAAHAVPFLREALAIESFVAIGHSVGGAMAIATAAQCPDHCTAAVTISAQSFVEECTLTGIRSARTAFEQPAQFQRLVRYHGEKARWVLDSWVTNWHSPQFAVWSLDPLLHAVRCPVLALHGDLDEYGSLTQPERIARLAQGRAVILEACGHIPHREQPARLLAELAEFLSSPGAIHAHAHAPHRRTL